MEGDYQNSISSLPPLKTTRYENIFKLYKTEDNFYFYNLLQSIYLPENIDETTIYYQQATTKMPWTVISYNAYKTTDLWWLICLANNIFNPIKFPEEGSLIKIIKPQYVTQILNEISNNLI